jgi:hypothetical protein
VLRPQSHCATSTKLNKGLLAGTQVYILSIACIRDIHCSGRASETRPLWASQQGLCSAEVRVNVPSSADIGWQHWQRSYSSAKKARHMAIGLSIEPVPFQVQGRNPAASFCALSTDGLLLPWRCAYRALDCDLGCKEKQLHHQTAGHISAKTLRRAIRLFGRQQPYHRQACSKSSLI